jgi:hypothetical protein
MEWLYWLAAFVGHGAFWVEVVNRVHGLGWPRRVIDAVTVACAAACAGAPLVALFTLVGKPTPGATPVWLAWYAAFSIAALVLIALTRIALVWDPRRCRESQRNSIATLDLASQLGRDATGSPLLHRLATLPGNSVLKPQLEHTTVPLERLPPALEGLRVAHLTDLHMSGRLARAYFERLIDEVNAWRPDLVCVTGDIVERMPQLDWIDPTLGQLKASVGCFFVLGNHDDKIDSQAMRRRLAEAGLVDVGGLSTEVQVRGVRLTVCGDERPWFKAEPPLRGDEPLTLCLAHTPDRFAWAIERGVDLVLAGHNHGGQVCLPGGGALLCPSRHGVRYAAGTFRHGRTVMHVGRGSGSLFPLRYGCPPEVALITLTRG